MNTSINFPSLVTFEKVGKFAINFGRLNNILVEYVVSPQHRVTSNDWIGIFPNDCSFKNTVDLDRLVSYEFILPRPVSTEELRYKVKITLDGATNLNFDEEYVLVYFSCNVGILGVSDPFRFIDPAAKKMSPRTQNDQNMSHFLTTENKQEMFSEYVKNNKSAKDRNYKSKQRFFSIPEKTPVENLALGGNEENVDKNQQLKAYKNKNYKFNQGYSNKVRRDLVPCSVNNYQPRTSCKPNYNYCSNCQRVGALLNKQAELYFQVKNLAEMNSELNEKIAHLEIQIELGQAAFQKQAVTLMRERESRVFYQHRLKESSELHQTGSDSQMDRAPKPDERIKINQMLKLKAVIGNQEEKLQALSMKLALEEEKVHSLTQQLEEIQCGKVQKVKAVMKDIGDLSCEDNSFNNNVGEEVESN